ncbi:hypothetical protein KCP75_13700 [Salmonella enterica subsp. enterica]|nr:hypothetical protein KCP75_13700 [Salmonella enterica subsp. enterica]
MSRYVRMCFRRHSSSSASLRNFPARSSAARQLGEQYYSVSAFADLLRQGAEACGFTSPPGAVYCCELLCSPPRARSAASASAVFLPVLHRLFSVLHLRRAGDAVLSSFGYFTLQCSGRINESRCAHWYSGHIAMITPRD